MIRHAIPGRRVRFTALHISHTRPPCSPISNGTPGDTCPDLTAGLIRTLQTRRDGVRDGRSSHNI